MTKTKPETERTIEDIDAAIYEIPDLPKIEIGDPLLNFSSTEAEDILEDNYINSEDLKEKSLEQKE